MYFYVKSINVDLLWLRKEVERTETDSNSTSCFVLSESSTLETSEETYSFSEHSLKTIDSRYLRLPGTYFP